MWRRILKAGILFFLPFSCFGQHDITEAAIKITGAESLETMDPYEMERLEDLAAHPLRINFASLSRLEESGLMTHYQAVSLIDYRSRHGDVLSLSELAAVDGFGSGQVALISQFISLESHASPFERRSDSLRLRHQLSARTGLKTGQSFSYGMKYRLLAGDCFTGSLAFSRTRDSPSMKPEFYSGNMMLYSKDGDRALVVGDYNARFGQGLAFWNGMSMSGMTIPSSLMKRPAGISASSSFSGNYSLRGLAGYMSFGKMRLSPFMSFRAPEGECKVLSGINASFLFRKGQASVTHYADMSFGPDERTVDDVKTSADIAWCFKGNDLFSEVALDWKSGVMAFLAGTVFPVGEDVKTGLVMRLYPSDFSSSRSASIRSLTKSSNEYAIGMSMEYSAGRWIPLRGRSGFGSSVRRHVASMSMDYSRHPVAKGDEKNGSTQFKLKVDWTAMLTDAWKLSLRFTERVRTWGNPFRTEARADLAFDCGKLAAMLRSDLVRCESVGFLSYVEGAYVEEASALYLRTGLFMADDWDDRIYAYERDAPGSFNVPAYYGRGFWASMMFRWKFARWGRVYVRASMLSYAFMKEKKPGRAELKLHFEFRL